MMLVSAVQGLSHFNYKLMRILLEELKRLVAKLQPLERYVLSVEMKLL